MQRELKLLSVVLMLLMATGCATSRGVLDIENTMSQNPAQGEAIKFVRVTDKRDFQIDPRQADIPSLKYNEIDDPSVTSRAIARKRNTYGKGLGDILLPEGKTVEGVVENRLTTGFRESGYRVLADGETGYADAIPVEVDIEKFWGWMNPGFWAIGISFETSIVVTAPVAGFSDGIEFDSHIQRKTQAASSGSWQTVINQSLDELNKDIQAELEAVQADKTQPLDN